MSGSGRAWRASAAMFAVVAAPACSLVTGYGDLVFGEHDAAASDAGLDADATERRDARGPDADAEVPDAGTGCVESACDDGIACTEDSCDADGTCRHRASDTLCPDGSTCDAARRGCVGGGCTDASDCNDAVLCTEDRCEAGVCVFAARRCDDGDPCTLDRCVAATGECSFPMAPNGVRCDEAEPALRCCVGQCVDTRDDARSCGGCGVSCGANERCVGSRCTCEDGFQSCDGEPGCESRTASDAMHCGTCDVACPPAQPTCAAGRCTACTTASDCMDDGLDCTSPPTCESGRCVHALAPDRCLIDGQCRRADERDPLSDCRACDPRRSVSAWSVRLGQPCDDGNGCTSSDLCSSLATCDGVALSCDDGLTCTFDACDALRGVCVYSPISSTCLIEGECRAAGATNPANPCQVCDPIRVRDDWSPASGSCDDGLFCTMGDTCTTTVAGPTCMGIARDCNDGQMCTTDRCDEPRRMCVHQPAAGSCYFDANEDGHAECVAAGTRRPMFSCNVCDPAVDPTGWTELGQGAACDDGLGVCCDGTCQAATSAPCTCTGCPAGRTCCEGITMCCLVSCALCAMM